MPEVPRHSTAPLLTRYTSARNFAGVYLLAVLAGAAIGAAAYYRLVEIRPAYAVALAVLPLLAAVVYGWVETRRVRYRLFPDSLEVQKGILARRIENLQLFRVRDVSLAQGILDRLLGVGDITLRSTDETTPVVVVRGVSAPFPLYEKLRALVAEQSARRTMVLEKDRGPAVA